MKCLTLKKPLAILALVAIAFTACKKEKPTNPADVQDPTNDAVAVVDSASMEDVPGLAMEANLAASTYYISPVGNNLTGDGSIGKPWKTLYKATSAVTTAGSTIHINAGTYTETKTSNLRVGVSLEGDGASSTIIKGAVTATYTALIEMASPDRTSGNQSISKITFNGQYVSEATHKTWLAIWITGRSNVSIHDCIIKNFYWRGVIFNGINEDNPGTDAGKYHATGNTFYNNTITNSADYGPNSGGGSGALNLGFQNGMLIYNNTIQQTERAEGKNGWPIKYWNQGWLKGVKIYNNKLIKKPYGGTYPGESGWDFAIEFFNIQGLEIYGNDIQNGAIDLNYNYKGAYPFSAWIHHNTISNPVLNSKVEGGIILEFRTESALIENNTFYNKSYGITFNTRGVANKGGDRDNFAGGNTPGGYSYLVDNIIRNNLFYNMYQGQGMGNSFGVGVISEGTDDPQINNMQVYNNTIVAKADNPSQIGIDLTSMPNGNGQNINIRNNIIQGFSYALKGSNGQTRINNLMFTHNNLYQNGNGNAANWPAGNPTNYTNVNNLAVNPLFVSATDFRLQASSPCINTGVMLGIPYLGSAPDRGYAESGQ
jgi:hypothetical protein